MSIIGDVTPALARHTEIIALAIFIAVVTGAAALTWLLGVFKRGRIVGPARVADNEPLGVIALLLGLGVIIWIFAQLLCGRLLGVGAANASDAASRPTTAAVASTVTLTPIQLAVVASGPGLFAFLLLAAAHAAIRRRGLVQLGLSASHFIPGVLMGLLGSLIAIPFTLLFAQITTYVWQLFRVQHPQEHELLRVLGESQNPFATALLIASAVLIAPLFEEMIFRGHLQTLITYGLSRVAQRRSRAPGGRGFEVILPGVEVGQAAQAESEPARQPPTAAMRWLSVIITSALFCMVHPFWMQPPIFVLALCLGYAYERTGNLWTSITMHAMFNTVSTLLFLFVMH